MIKISKLTDYAVIVMAWMSRATGSIQTVPRIAEMTGLPQPTVAKVLKPLVAAELVVSYRGAAGGYALVRPASAITLAEIITAVDGPIQLTTCSGVTAQGCAVSGPCLIRGGWEAVNRAVREAVASVRLSDMLRDDAPQRCCGTSLDAAGDAAGADEGCCGDATGGCCQGAAGRGAGAPPCACRAGQ